MSHVQESSGVAVYDEIAVTPPRGLTAASTTYAPRPGLSILIIDDDRMLREGCASFLQSDGYIVSVTGRGDEAIEIVRRRRFDFVLVDWFMTQVPGAELVKATLRANPSTVVIAMTGDPSVSSSIEAFQAGAYDYLAKPFTATQLEVLIGRAAFDLANSHKDRSTAELDPAGTRGTSDRVTLLGVSPAIRAAVQLARRVAATNASVMIFGESGTGKEVIAQFVHAHSRRADRSLVALNCAALPAPLLESEMFGHRRGAFTGADRDKAGLLEAANGGTMFLDEITEMALPLQAKLLRVLQDGVVRRVGSEQSDAVVDVRFISATNRDPFEAVRDGYLREDLLYRLRVVPISLPPLRQRQEDIPILANHFLAQAWTRHHRLSERPPVLTEATLEFMKTLPWRGNVRELQNLIEYVAVLAEARQPIHPHDLPLDDARTSDTTVADFSSVGADTGYHAARDHLVSQFERVYLTQIVERARGNMSQAARMASIDRTTLYRLMEKHGLGRAGAATLR